MLQCTLLELCEEMTGLIDDPRVADFLGPAGIELSNALADYRDSRPSDAFEGKSPSGRGEFISSSNFRPAEIRCALMTRRAL